MSAVQRYVNIFAFMGWFRVLAGVFAESPDTFRTTMMVQAVCVVEVLQIAIGLQKGNLPLGIALHLVRVVVLTQALPVLGWCLATKGVLMSWAVTEMCRYPMFLQPYSGLLRKLRYTVPVLTFPTGAGSEAWACYQAATAGARDRPDAVYYVLLGVVVTNILGGLYAYVGIVDKARKALKEPPPVPPPEPEEEEETEAVGKSDASKASKKAKGSKKKK